VIPTSATPRRFKFNWCLAIDTCGSSGSVALGRLTGDEVEVLSQIELEGRTYSATLVAP